MLKINMALCMYNVKKDFLKNLLVNRSPELVNDCSTCTGKYYRKNTAHMSYLFRKLHLYFLSISLGLEERFEVISQCLEI